MCMNYVIRDCDCYWENKEYHATKSFIEINKLTKYIKIQNGSKVNIENEISEINS